MITKIKIHNNENNVSLKSEIQRTLDIFIENIKIAKIYRCEGFSEEQAHEFAQKVLVDPINQRYEINCSENDNTIRKIEIGKKPGVMNPEVATLFKAARDLRLSSVQAIDISNEYQLYGAITDKELQSITSFLMNETIERKIEKEPKSLLFHAQEGNVAQIPLRSMHDADLSDFSKQQQLYLSFDEMQAIQNYFITENRDPYDAELETLAQTWSEHCYHKTFKSDLIINGITKKSLFSRLKETAKLYNEQVVSAFIDNSGAFSFYEDFAILGKVETHNSPSAIEPYGGASTGSGGVFRDIMGTGKGARVIASTDMFCFASPDLSQDEVPKGCLHPKYLLQKVVDGVRDYGNRMGIPTNNGSFHFHNDFRAKPTVIVGGYGIIPISKAEKGKPEPHDLIILIGGRTGIDGIHGATFSSASMNAQTGMINATAVQIGNAIEEKRMADAILELQEKNLIKAITDCGAGGLSSAVGEMASEIGCSVYLERVPLKYAGLHPWQIWISESQERMVCAISPEHQEEFLLVCKEYNVEVAEIGIFTNSKKLHVFYNMQVVCDIDMEFLHKGIPKQTLVGAYTETEWEELKVPELENWQEIYCALLAHHTICSKEPVVRQYDHTVQGTSALSSFSGKYQDGPNDAAILTPLLGKSYGLILSHGMNPSVMERDPYEGSWWAIVESLSNLVAVGGNVSNACLIDNFIWPCPNEKYIGLLDQSMQACVDAMNLFKIPFISGKDSLSSTYYYSDGKILNIPPVLCISAMGKIPDITKTVTSDFKNPDSMIVLIGSIDMQGLGGSVYLDIRKFDKQFYRIPKIAKNKLSHLFQGINKLVENDILYACHDVSEGGIAVALAEMCFGGDIGCIIDLSFLKNSRADFFLFSETPGCFLVEMNESDIQHLDIHELDYLILGRTNAHKNIIINDDKKVFCNISLDILKSAWQSPFKEIFT